jgi:hypothetical protein
MKKSKEPQIHLFDQADVATPNACRKASVKDLPASIRYPERMFRVDEKINQTSEQMLKRIQQTSYKDLENLEDYIEEWYKKYPDGKLSINKICIVPMELVEADNR